MSCFRLPTEVTYAEAAQLAARALKTAGYPAQEAQWLLMEPSGWTLTDWVTRSGEVLSVPTAERYATAVNERLSGRPLQYILGTVTFLGREFVVTPDVLIPRPETEEWMERALSELAPAAVTNTSRRVLDLGVGSGVIAISHQLVFPADTVTAVDICPAAAAVARKNAERLQAEVTVKVGDLWAPVAGEVFDVIYSNPPYIGEDERSEMGADVLAHEPTSALFAAADGYAVYFQLADQLAEFLAPEGQAFFEIGYRQAARVVRLFEDQLPGAHISVWQDFGKRDRLVHIQRKDKE